MKVTSTRTYRLRWDAADNTMVYLSYTEGYKSGGFNPSPDTSNPDGSPGEGTEFEPEEAEAWELGVKSSLWDDRARLSATLFHTEVDDLQVTSFQGTNFIVGNAAAMTSQGVELEAQLALTADWEVGGALAYLDSQFDDFDNAPCTIYQCGRSGCGLRAGLGGGEGTERARVERRGLRRLRASNLGRSSFRFNISGSYTDEYFLDGDLDRNTLQDSYVKVNAQYGISGRRRSVGSLTVRTKPD